MVGRCSSGGTTYQSSLTKAATIAIAAASILPSWMVSKIALAISSTRPER